MTDRIDEKDLPRVSPAPIALLRAVQNDRSVLVPLPSVVNASAMVEDSIQRIDTAGRFNMNLAVNRVSQDGYNAVTNVVHDVQRIVDDAYREAGVILDGLGYLPPVEYEEGLSVDSSRFTVLHDGHTYAPATVPFTTGSAFDPDQWRLVQGITAETAQALDVIQRHIVLGQGVPLTLFKNVGNTWAEAWADWVEYIDTNSVAGYIPPGAYDLSEVEPYDIVNGITIRGAGSEVVLLDALGGPSVLFTPGSMGRFCVDGVSTRRLGLLNGNITSNVSLVRVRDWQYSCVDERPFFLNSVFEEHGCVVDDIELDSIYGRGGICGVQCVVAYRRANVDRIDVGGIFVEDDDAYFEDVGGTLNMLSRGYNGGLIIGYDSEDAVTECEHLAVGTVVVDGVLDGRTKRGSGRTANCDGVKFHGSRNVTFGSITVKNVTSTYKSDTSGFYHKVVNMVGGSLLLVNAGHHEASWTVKGRYRGDASSSTNSNGWNIDVKSVTIINDEGFVGRTAVYLSTEDIRIGTLYVEGCGGDVEDPNNLGARLSGTGGVVYTTASNSLSRLSISELQLVNCKFGNIVTNRLVRLDAYRDIYIGRIVIDGADNGGLFSTQTVGDEQNVRAVSVMASQAMERMEIGSLSVRNCETNGKTMTALSLEGGAAVAFANIGSIVVDGTVNVGILTIGTPVSILQIGQGDLSGAATPINYSTARPSEVDIGTVKGVTRQMILNGTSPSGTTNWINNNGTLTVDSGNFKLARSGGSQGRAYQALNCEVGKIYTVSAWVSPGSQSPSSPNASVYIGTTAGTPTGAILSDQVYGNPRCVTLTFRATQAQHYLLFTTHSSGSGAQDGDYILFNNVSCLEVGR